MLEDDIVIVTLLGIGAMKGKHQLLHTVAAPWIKDITPSFPAQFSWASEAAILKF